jgi:hypothetical protein
MATTSKRKILSIQAQPWYYEKVSDAAYTLKMSKSDLMRNAINEYLEKYLPKEKEN